MKKSVAFQSTYALVKLIFTPSWPYFMSIPVMKFTELSERVRRHFSKYWNLIKQSAVHTHTRVSLLCVRRIYVHICTYVCAHTTGRMTRIWTRPPPDTCHHRLLHYDGPADLPVRVIQSWVWVWVCVCRSQQSIESISFYKLRWILWCSHHRQLQLTAKPAATITSPGWLTSYIRGNH